MQKTVQIKDKPALIIIDMQKDFVMPGGSSMVIGAQGTIPKIKEILTWFRNKKYPVFHVIREYREDGSDIEITRLAKFLNERKTAVPGTEGCEIVDELKPTEGDYKIIKNRFSGFMNTELDWMLRRLNVGKIAVCGTQYPNCIRATVFDGVSYGYTVEVLTDATSASTPEIAEANIIDIKNIGVKCLTIEEFIKNNLNS